MPLALEPGLTFDVVLDSDKGKTDPPVFVYRFLSGREWRTVAKMQDQLEGAKDADAVVDLVYQAAAVGLVGWSGMVDPEQPGAEIPFKIGDLDMVLGMTEAQELILKMMKQTPTTDEKKN